MTQPEPADVDALKAQIEALGVANDAAITAIAQQGIAVNIDGIRAMALAEHLLGDENDPRRLAYELYVQNVFTKVVADVQGQINRAKLLQGVTGAQVPGQR